MTAKRAARAKKQGSTPKRRGRGRPKGSPNKATADVRKAIAMIAERNVLKFEGWLTRTATKSPAKAADIFLRAIEYHVPKLARTEHVGGDGGAIQHAVASMNISDADAMAAYLKMVKEVEAH